MSTALSPAFFAAVAAAFAAFLSYRSSTQANRTSDRRVDIDDHKATVERYQAIIGEQDRYAARLREEVERITSRMETVQQQAAREADVSNLLRSQIAALQGQIFALEQLASLPRPPYKPPLSSPSATPGPTPQPRPNGA